MAIAHLDGLYPLFSDMEINDVDPRDQLKVPTPRPRRRKKASSSRMARNYKHYKAMQRRANQHCASITSPPAGFPSPSRRPRHRSKSSSLDTLFSLTPNIASREGPLPPTMADREHCDDCSNHSNANFAKNLEDANHRRRGHGHSPKVSITRINTHALDQLRHDQDTCSHTRGAHTAHPSHSSIRRKSATPTPRAHTRHQKRRIRTFYSKKWGNRLFGLTCRSPRTPLSAPVTSCKPPPFPMNPVQIDTHCDAEDYHRYAHHEHEHERGQSLISLSGMELWRSSLCSMRSPSPSPICVDHDEDDADAHHLGVAADFRFTEHARYDSAASMLAANTDADDEGDDADDDQDHDDERQELDQREGPEPETTSPLTVTGSQMAQRAQSPRKESKRSTFKIVVSEPSDHHHAGRSEEERARDRDQFNSRMTAKRTKRRRYIVSDYDCESGMSCSDSNDCSSSDDCSMDDEDTHSGLFLSGNDLNVGVYSSFSFNHDISDISGQSDSDYLSAQSDDFDELTICYHNDRNIRFRGNREVSYLSDLGPSDIGSSDTECFSSADSIPEHLPPVPGAGQ